MDNYEEIINYINENSDKIISDLKDESIAVYAFIKSQIKNEPISLSKNYLFQFIFLNYYGLDRIGFSDEFLKDFFEVFEQYRKKPDKFDLIETVKRFYEYDINDKKNYQFSFFTKLYHTIDTSKPIYDSNVCRAIGLKLLKKDNKLDQLIERYGQICDLYNRIKKEKSLSSTIKKFDNRFKKNGISFNMKLDFIFWQTGKLKYKERKDNL